MWIETINITYWTYPSFENVLLQKCTQQEGKWIIWFSELNKTQHIAKESNKNVTQKCIVDPMQMNTKNKNGCYNNIIGYVIFNVYFL